MEIKRTTEIFVETRRQYIIRQPESAEHFFCPQCNEPMLTAEQAAAFFQTNCRAIYRLIEANTAHFFETETGAALVCPISLAAILETCATQLPEENSK
jgi:hypothetical protein